MSQSRRHLEHHPGINPAPFKAIVKSVTDEGVILSDSWCYPKGGGQPGDTGVFRSGGEEFQFGEVSASSHILHPVSSENLKIGQEVDCVIDVERRNALAAMHSAAHIVSATANERWGAITVGNQLGVSESRMDLKFENRDEFDVNILPQGAMIFPPKLPIAHSQQPQQSSVSLAPSPAFPESRLKKRPSPPETMGHQGFPGFQRLVIW